MTENCNSPENPILKGIFQIYKINKNYYISPLSNLESIANKIKEVLGDNIELLNNQFISCFGAMPNFNFKKLDDINDFVYLLKESNSKKIIDFKLITQVDINFILFYDMEVPNKSERIDFNLFDEKFLEEAEYCYKFKYNNENKYFDYH